MGVGGAVKVSLPPRVLNQSRNGAEALPSLQGTLSRKWSTSPRDRSLPVRRAGDLGRPAPRLLPWEAGAEAFSDTETCTLSAVLAPASVWKGGSQGARWLLWLLFSFGFLDTGSSL